jgi:hypothetical protein
MSSDDISKGKPWFATISEQLARSRVCVLCVTPENVGSAWLYYEAGAIAHALRNALVCPYLIGVGAGHLAATPLGQFQCTSFEKEDTWRLLKTLNQQLERPHEESLLRGNLDAKWSSLKRSLDKVVADLPADVANAKDVEETEELSEAAREIITRTANDSHGSLMMLVSSGGYHLQTNGAALCEENNPRVEATYRAAVKDLVRRGFLEREWGRDGDEGFRITDIGFRLADTLSKGSEPR